IAHVKVRARGVGLEPHFDRLASSVLDRVGEEVRHDLLEAHAIPPAEDLRRRAQAERAGRRVELLAEALAHVSRYLREIDGLKVQRRSRGSHLRYVEQVGYELLKALNTILYHVPGAL